MDTIAKHSGWRLTVAVAAAATFAAALLALLMLGGAPPAGAATATASGSKTVSIKNFKYLPKNLHVTKGTKVVFANSSGVAHTATGAGFDTGKIRPGKAVAVKFTGSGTYSYHCTIHPFMHGKITVG
jgi:plastocyanin